MSVPPPFAPLLNVSVVWLIGLVSITSIAESDGTLTAPGLMAVAPLTKLVAPFTPVVVTATTVDALL